MQEWNEASRLNHIVQGGQSLGIITSGISFMHVREAAPEARVLKLGFTHPRTGKVVECEAPMPEEMTQLWQT